ncbi:MAG: RsmE family RNA methyltransferase [Oscillospiraceae bacterium]|nr:RsmE family RNA methyltransferase [Oscillospiraceae bacterium]MDD3832427.1 RsmE family RNA methyltransferase [Oscillospiraceae bacterium]MDD4546152.1 RsmE family RNA methyltransferase [Oscillospiraceae bacterium]
MPRFFTDFSGGDIAVIKGEDAVHIRRSLRLRIGDNLTLCDGRGSDYFCDIKAFDGDEVVLKVLYQKPSTCEPSIEVILYQGLPKGDKLELIIQKAVELGVTKIIPVEMARSIVRISGSSDKFEKKLRRLQKISDEAAGQSGRGILPRVEAPMSFRQALNMMGEEGTPIIAFYEGGGQRISELISNQTKRLSVIIGPEGGFEPSEIEQLTDIGASVATLGKRILRCETAPIAALAVIMALTGNLD